MKCPVDNTTLIVSDRQGIEIDYCPTCKGVWLDRGELDKIIDRSETLINMPQQIRHSNRFEDRQEHFKKNNKSKFTSLIREIFDL